MIVCGWCGAATPEDRCPACGHEDPARPWIQRGDIPPEVIRTGGRPPLVERDIRRRYAEAKRSGAVTVEQLAEQLDVSPRTLRDWRKRFALS